MIASTGKMLAAIAIANEGKDTTDTLYLDTEAPAHGLETCEKGGTERHGRTRHRRVRVLAQRPASQPRRARRPAALQAN